MTTRKNTSRKTFRKTLLALGLVLGVLALSLAGWRASAHESDWRWLAQPAPASSAQPQTKRGGRVADAWWAKLRGLGAFGLGKMAGVPFADGAALNFDGVDDKVTIPHNASLNSLPLTVECWMKSTDADGGTLVNKYFNASANGWALDFGTQPRAYYYNPSGGSVNLTGTANVTDGAWHHVAAVFDTSGVKLYVDGVLNASQAWSGPAAAVTTTQPINLGLTELSGGSGHFLEFQGSLDEVRIWSGARSLAEIQAFKDTEITAMPSCLTAYYKFSEGTADGVNTGVTTLPDIANAVANTGTLANFALTGSTGNWTTGSGITAVTSAYATDVPEINLKGNGNSIADGTTATATGNNTDFGSSPTGVGVTKSFTIENVGPGPLTVSAISFSGAHANNFVVSGITLPATVAASGSTTINVTFTPSAVGTRTATINVISDDCDESNYDFALTGVGSVNTAPTVSAANPTITVNEGTATSNALTVNDAEGGTITVTASTGTVAVLASATYLSEFSTTANPRRLAIDSAGNLYVGASNGVVTKYNPSGTQLLQFTVSPAPSPASDDFNGIDVGPDGSIYIGTNTSNTTLKYSSTGTFVGAFGPNRGTYIWGGRFGGPSGNFYQLDRFHRLSLMSAAGANQWTTSGYNAGVQEPPNTGLWGPADVAVHPTTGASYVVDYFGSSGITKAFDASGATTGYFYNNGITIDMDAGGNLWMSSGTNVRKFTPGGIALGSFGTFGTGAGQFQNVNSIRFDAAGNLWVLDYTRNKLIKFSVSQSSYAWLYTPTDGPAGPTTVTITATDSGSPALSSSTTFILNVNNVAPLFEAGANETLPTTVGAFSRGPLSFTDPGAEVWTGTVNYGDGTGNQALTINQAGKSFSLSHTYAASGTFTVTVTVNDDDGGSFTDSFTVTVNLNTPPTIAATANTRQQGSPATVSAIATVGDNEQSAGSLAVTVNGGATATVNGVTVSNLVNTNGAITASIVADCTATNASFTLTTTDSAGATAMTTLNVTVTANTAPVLSYGNQSVGAASSLTINPATGPSDNGNVASITVLSATPALLTAPTVASNGVVTITNAGPSGNHTVTIRATDNCGLTTDASFTLNVTCPTLTLSPATIPGGTVGTPYLPTSFSAAGGNGTVSYSLSGTLPTGMTFVSGQLADTPTESGSFPITITATDAYGCSMSKNYTLVISCPTISISPSTLPIAQISTAYPAQTITASGGTAPYTITLSGALPTGMSFTSGYQLVGTPTAPGDFPLTVNVTDKYGCTASRSLSLKVNRPPVALSHDVTVTTDATCTANADINNGSSDPDGDTLTLTQTPAGPYAVGTRTVTLTVSDGNGGTRTSTATVTVDAPKPVPVITGPVSGTIYQVNTPINFTGTFTDLAGTTHTASWKFESATPPVITTAGTVVEPAGATPGSSSVTQSFTTAGVYLVTLTVTNQCGGGGSAATIGTDQFSALVVIYDPGAGFVTGGGWINSPAGAYPADPLLTGKANFGFVSKYQNGNSVPTGNTEFQFKAGNLNFKSTVYEWLVVAGAKAQYKGSGKINGVGDYRFMLTAIDGQVNGGGGQDKFRLRIWNNAGGGLVYDNQMNAPDSNDPTTVLGGGSIVIHK